MTAIWSLMSLSSSAEWDPLREQDPGEIEPAHLLQQQASVCGGNTKASRR